MIWATEVGIQTRDQQKNLPTMLDVLTQEGVAVNFIHETQGNNLWSVTPEQNPEAVQVLYSWAENYKP